MPAPIGSANPQPAAGRRYSGATSDQRRQRRRRALLTAAADLARDQGLPAVGYRAVCRRAALSERYFYESFTDVDDLLTALFAEQLGVIVERVSAAVADAEPTPHATIHVAIAAFVDHIAADPLRARMLVDSAAHPALRELRAHALQIFADMMIEVAREFYGTPVDARTRRRNRHVTVALAGGLNEILSQWIDTPVARESHVEIIEDTTALFAAAVQLLSREPATTVR
jgi:AcrR family transcriptional regulator